MLLNSEVIERMVGTPKAIDIATAELGVVPGGNIWSFNEGDELVIDKANYDEAEATMVDGKRVTTALTPAQEKKATKTTFKYIKVEGGKLLSLGTGLRRDREGKFHPLSKDLPTSISIAEILDEIDGKTIKCVAVGSFKTPTFGTDRKPALDEKGQPVMRDQKHYAWEVA